MLIFEQISVLVVKLLFEGRPAGIVQEFTNFENSVNLRQVTNQVQGNIQFRQAESVPVHIFQRNQELVTN